jgi:hypothetical protein
MIDGIHCDVSTDEMRTLLGKRIKYHEEKATFYAKTAKDLTDSGLQVSGGSSRDPVGDLQTKVKEHQSRIEFLTFVAAHLVEGETYRLSEHDMARLGFISERY